MMNRDNPGSGSISGSDLIDAKLEEHQLCGSTKCPSCGHKLDGKPDWVGLPAGVKFDPTDQELIEHLEAKVLAKDNKSHPLIDEFIPTIEGDDGICYTHPEKLPGVTRDGLSRHFFHRPSKAYTTGTRKRRKIQNECCDNIQGTSSSSSTGETRWHKTGKTRPVLVNGKQKGCKKILVLYTNFGKNRKPEKTNWVMHQYHLGQHEEEREGELVVSKIFYQTQPRQCNWSSERSIIYAGAGEGSGSAAGELHHISTIVNRPRDSCATSGSCSSKEVINISPHMAGRPDDGLPGYAMDQLSFVPFRKTFDEVGMGEASRTREAPSQVMCDEIPEQHHHHGSSSSSSSHHVSHDRHHHHHHHQVVSAAFHISHPTHPISNIISPSTSLHHTSINILEEGPFHVPRLLLPSESFQTQEHQQQQHHSKMGGGRSASGLEELIMGCTSSTHHHDAKEDSSMANPQEAEWLRYPSFWPAPGDSDNQDHHGDQETTSSFHL